MTSWLPLSLHLPFRLFSRLQVFCMKMCSPLAAGLQSYLTGLTIFFVYWISFPARTRRHSNLLVALFFVCFQNSHLFSYHSWLTLVQPPLSLCDGSVWFLWLLIFFDCISFNLCSRWSPRDSTPVNLPVMTSSSLEKKPCWSCWPKVHQRQSYSTVRHILLFGYTSQAVLQTVTYCSWFAPVIWQGFEIPIVSMSSPRECHTLSAHH